jgi:hypothetical protein
MDGNTPIERVTLTGARQGTDYLKTVEHGFLHRAYLFPVQADNILTQILKERARLKKAYDDSMALVYQLRNAVTRGDDLTKLSLVPAQKAD